MRQSHPSHLLLLLPLILSYLSEMTPASTFMKSDLNLHLNWQGGGIDVLVDRSPPVSCQWISVFISQLSMFNLIIPAIPALQFVFFFSTGWQIEACFGRGRESFEIALDQHFKEGHLLQKLPPDVWSFELWDVTGEKKQQHQDAAIVRHQYVPNLSSWYMQFETAIFLYWQSIKWLPV